MFIDEVKIHVRAGKGGNGVIHFRREKFVPRGGPDGGDGGKGGDIILEVVATLNTLLPFQHKTSFYAQDGANGSKSNMTGRSGEELVIPVPPGTVVYNAQSGEIIGDLVNPGQKLVVVKGGRGGRGNARFATSVNQVPRVAEKGEPGEEIQLHLELRLIADIGIVGVPNAGKSTLLAAVTNAKPKIADYPFTTLEPNLGVARLDDEHSLILADIPGLIEGAHLGFGLGYTFLRHIQRTRVLIHLLDGLSENPLLDFIQINSELALFDPDLARKPQVVALNKIDLPQVVERWPEFLSGFQNYLNQKKQEIIVVAEPYAISALARKNLHPLLYRVLQALNESQKVIKIHEMPVYRSESDPQAFTIDKVRGGWRVSGKAIERAAKMTYWEHYQSVRRFQKILATLGVEQALREAGVQNGDTVFIGENELEWQD